MGMYAKPDHSSFLLLMDRLYCNNHWIKMPRMLPKRQFKIMYIHAVFVRNFINCLCIWVIWWGWKFSAPQVGVPFYYHWHILIKGLFSVKKDDGVILIFNKDMVNIITFNWTKMLKYLIIPTSNSPVSSPSICFNCNDLVIGNNNLESSCHYWWTLFSLEKVSAG